MANDRADAETVVAVLAFFGVLAGVVGTVWAFAAWPEEGTGDSVVVAVLGLAVAIAGGFSLMAAVVAWSVRLGIQWSGLRDDIVHDVLQPTTPSAPSHLDADGL